MTLYDSLITNTTPAPPKLIVYGSPGRGKTTLAADAGALLIDCENGAGEIPGLRRTPYLPTWPAMRAWLVELAMNPPKDIRVVAVDTLDWMVQRITEHVVIDLDKSAKGDLTNTLGSAHGGFFKSRGIVQNVVYRDLLPLLNAINAHGLPVLLLAHAHNTKITTPEGFELRQAAPDLPEWILPTFVEWVDAVLYLMADQQARKLHTEGTNLVLAKNRYNLPPVMPCEKGAAWRNLMAAIIGGRQPEPKGK